MFFLGYLPYIYLVLSSKLACHGSYWLLYPLTPERSKTPRHRSPVQRHRRGHLEVFLGTLLASMSVWGTGLPNCYHCFSQCQSELKSACGKMFQASGHTPPKGNAFIWKQHISKRKKGFPNKLVPNRNITSVEMVETCFKHIYKHLRETCKTPHPRLVRPRWRKDSLF